MIPLNETKELINQIRLYLLEDYEEKTFIVTDKETYQALTLPTEKKEIRSTPTQRIAPPPPKPLFKKMDVITPPLKEKPYQEAHPQEKKEEEKKDDFGDIRRFFTLRYPNITLFTEPQVSQKKRPYEDISIGIITGSHPVINSLTQALEKQFGKTELISIDEILKCPSLKLVIDHTNLSTFEPTLNIADLNELQSNPVLKKNLWKTIQLKMGGSL